MQLKVEPSDEEEIGIKFNKTKIRISKENLYTYMNTERNLIFLVISEYLLCVDTPDRIREVG